MKNRERLEKFQLKNLTSSKGDSVIAGDILKKAVLSVLTIGAIVLWIPKVPYAAWGTEILIETSTEVAFLPKLAISDGGSAVAVWAQEDGGVSGVWANRYEVGIGWGSAVRIEANSGRAQEPQVAIDRSGIGSGNAIAVWVQEQDDVLSVWANRYEVGVGWGSATLIESNPGDAGFPRIAMNRNGDAVVLWKQFDGERYDIWANRYVAEVGWETPTLVETSTEDASETWVAIDNGGNAMAVWRQSDGTDLSIWANRYVVGTGWGTATLIETNPGFASYPHVAMDRFGNALVVWYQVSPGESVAKSIWANRYVVGVGWETATLIETNSVTAQGPDLAMNGSGNAMAVWKQSDGVDTSIWANQYVFGAGWGTATLIETAAGPAERPDIAMNSNGDATVVWQQFDGRIGSIWANRYLVGTGWGTATLVESGSDLAEQAQVEMDRNGNALAVWTQQNSIWANRFSN